MGEAMCEGMNKIRVAAVTSGAPGNIPQRLHLAHGGIRQEATHLITSMFCRVGGI